ncbi:MAG: AAA family ATPase, partial [Treponema sp.]|nr:AAA family ATPase [Treponema sp.]
QDKYKRNLERFTEMLDMKGFINQPVRQLSLGQRMRSDIVASLLHSPDIVFFDEPTIGVDVIGKETIRSFIRQLNEEDKVTMIFTTHDMQDIEQTCNRIIIIDKGSLMYDGSLHDIRSKYGTARRLIAEFNEETKVSPIENVDIGEMKDRKISFSFDNNIVDVNKLMHEILDNYNVRDITVAEPEIESIIQKMYNGMEV